MVLSFLHLSFLRLVVCFVYFFAIPRPPLFFLFFLSHTCKPYCILFMAPCNFNFTHPVLGPEVKRRRLGRTPCCIFQFPCLCASTSGKKKGICCPNIPLWPPLGRCARAPSVTCPSVRFCLCSCFVSSIATKKKSGTKTNAAYISSSAGISFDLGVCVWHVSFGHVDGHSSNSHSLILSIQ